MDEKYTLPPFEKVNVLNPPSKAEVARACYKDIDERTDKILALTRSVEIERQIDRLWDSVQQLYHLSNWEEAIDAWNTRAERTCRMEWDEDGEGDELYPVGHVTCSACGAWLYAVNTMRFCPECGAKVTEEDTDGRQRD